MPSLSTNHTLRATRLQALLLLVVGPTPIKGSLFHCALHTRPYNYTMVRHAHPGRRGRKKASGVLSASWPLASTKRYFLPKAYKICKCEICTAACRARTKENEVAPFRMGLKIPGTRSNFMIKVHDWVFSSAHILELELISFRSPFTQSPSPT